MTRALSIVRCAVVLVTALALGSCEQADELGVLESNVSAAVRRERATAIRDQAREMGITNGLMIAMLAEEETYLSHCASEFPACPGPASPSCGGRPVISGGGDGPCSIDQGGLGMFQIDDGTESNTVRVHGERVLTLRGNTEVAINRMIQKLIVSHYVSISNRAEAIAFINALRIDDRNWDNYISTLVRYWNGCPQGASCWSNRYPKYDRGARTLLRELGRDFWYGADHREDPTTPEPSLSSPWIASPLGDGPFVTSHVAIGGQTYSCAASSRGTHRGTDFRAAIGTPVRAVSTGTVIRSVTGCSNAGSLSNTCGGSYGNHVIVLHDNGFATLYAHFSPGGQVRQGARVDCGDVLGRSGNSGRSSGPHLHFEVRRNVRDIVTYYATNNTVHPWGGRCSSQDTTLWIGGAPSRTCEVAPERARSDSSIVRRTYRSTVRGAPGTRLTQVFTFRNTGSTTWTADDFVLQHRSGSFSSVREVTLPAGARVAPGQRIRLRVTVTVPSSPGTYRGEWRMARRSGGRFGAVGSLSVRVAREPRQCSSWTLGRNVESGECVQTAYPGCGLRRCEWFRCSDGAWYCTQQSDCSGAEHEHPWCTPRTDPGDGCTDELLDRTVAVGGEGFRECTTAGQYQRCACTSTGWSTCGTCMSPR